MRTDATPDEYRHVCSRGSYYGDVFRGGQSLGNGKDPRENPREQ